VTAKCGRPKNICLAAARQIFAIKEGLLGTLTKAEPVEEAYFEEWKRKNG
jgi:hypothetical protein